MKGGKPPSLSSAVRDKLAPCSTCKGTFSKKPESQVTFKERTMKIKKKTKEKKKKPIMRLMWTTYLGRWVDTPSMSN